LSDKRSSASAASSTVLRRTSAIVARVDGRVRPQMMEEFYTNLL